MQEFPHLFSPLTIGGVVWKNRILAAPFRGPDFAPDGSPLENNIEMYERRAMGGQAEVCIGEISVDFRYANRTPFCNCQVKTYQLRRIKTYH